MANASSRWRALLSLGRASNVPTVWSNVLAGWFLAGGGLEWPLLGMLLGATAIYLGGAALNDACDANFDRQYRPERPIPSGVFSRQQVFGISLGLSFSGVAVVIVAGQNIWLPLLLVGCIAAYDIVHKKTRWACLLMGGARALLFLTAASAGLQTSLVWIFASALLLYITGLTWHAAAESGPSKPTHPLAQSCLLLAPLAAAVVASLVDFPGALGLVAALACALFFLSWISPAMPTRRPSLPPPVGIPRLLLAIVMVDAIALCWANLYVAALVLLGLGALARHWQKSVAAT